MPGAFRHVYLRTMDIPGPVRKLMRIYIGVDIEIDNKGLTLGRAARVGAAHLWC